MTKRNYTTKERITKGIAIFSEGLISPNGGQFQHYVNSQSSETRYTVHSRLHTDGGYCDCPDSQQRNVVCKHQIAATMTDLRNLHAKLYEIAQLHTDSEVYHKIEDLRTAIYDGFHSGRTGCTEDLTRAVKLATDKNIQAWIAKLER